MTDTLLYTMPADIGEPTQILPQLSDGAKSSAARIVDKVLAAKIEAKKYIERFMGIIEDGVRDQNATTIGRAAGWLDSIHIPGGKQFIIEKDLGEKALQVCIASKLLWAITEVLEIMEHVDGDLGKKALMVRMESDANKEDRKCHGLAKISDKMGGENALQVCLDNYSNTITGREIGCIACYSQTIGQVLGTQAIHICITEKNTQAIGEVVEKMQEIEEDLGEKALRICVKNSDTDAIEKVIRKMKKVNPGLGKKALTICIDAQKGWSLLAIPDIASKMGYIEATAYILEVAGNDLCDHLTKEAWFLGAVMTLTGTPSESTESAPEKVVGGTRKRVSKLVPAKMIPANFPREKEKTV